MKISIFGLGYVGAVTAGCLARHGHQIVGAEIQPSKVALFNAGLSPIVEPGLAELLREAKAGGRLRATTIGAEAIAETEISIICVGTPAQPNGALELDFVREVLTEIGSALRRKGEKHALVLRSTMLPGSTEAMAGEFFSDLIAGQQLDVYYFPEFLREGTAVADFEDPSLAAVGTRDGSPPPPELMRGLFGPNSAVVTWRTAEMLKYACNAFHAAKITFANEMGRVGKQLGIDSRAVMDLLCLDTRLNLAPYYLKPGNPFGGSCLPKDLRALTHHARVNGVSLPMLENILPSNDRHLQELLSLVTNSGKTEACILGLSFKLNTDDLRHSPMVETAQALLGSGFKLRIYDPALSLGALVGANKRDIDTRMPHLASLLSPDLESALGADSVVIAAQPCVSIAELRRFITPRHHVIDVNSWPALQELPARYEGLCW